MGASHSQENNRAQDFSTIGLPPSMVHQQHQRLERNETLPVSSEIPHPNTFESKLHRRERPYRLGEESQSSAVDTEPDDWVHVDQVSHKVKRPTRSQLSPAPTALQPPTLIHDGTQDNIEIPRLTIPRLEGTPSRSLRDDEEQEFADLSDLLSRLQLRVGSSNPNLNGNRTSGRTRARAEVVERRIHRQHQSTENVGGSHSRPRHHSSRVPGPPFIFLRGFEKTKCPLCSKEFSVPDFEEHLALCSTKPRVQFNVDKLTQDSGECSICLDDLVSGDEIGRLPCLCVYHVKCLRGWYKKNQTCPEHPDLPGTA